MADAIDLAWLGERLLKERKARGLTLEEVAKETGVSIPTLSRVERGESRGLKGETLIKLTEWTGTPSKLWKKATAPPNMPDFVELHLRADKNLDGKTAEALAQLFRTAY